MTENIARWWHNHSESEQRLMTVLGLLIAIVVIWLGIWRPVNAGLLSGWERQGAALDRYASVKAKVLALRRMPVEGKSEGRVPIDQLIGQSAAEAGFTLDRAATQGNGQMSINIASARVGPLLGWLSTLETSGVRVDTISIVPGGTDGTVTVQAVVKGAER